MLALSIRQPYVELILKGRKRIEYRTMNVRKMLGERWSVVPDRIAVMHPGVDTTRFTPAPRDAVARARLGWTGRRVVLTVGALQRRKGQDMMIRALPVIRQHCLKLGAEAVFGRDESAEFIAWLRRLAGS